MGKWRALAGGGLGLFLGLAACATPSAPTEDPAPVERVGVVQQPMVGVPVDGYPNYQERLMLTAINRGRADPNVVGETAADCSTAKVQSAPLMLNHAGSRCARFHCANNILSDGGLSHNSYCDVDPNIGSSFESTCDGSASCACLAGTDHFTCTTLGGMGTGSSTRCSYFGYSSAGEVGAAGYSNGWTAVFGWISECPPNDGHRNILNTVNRNEIGMGYYTGSTDCWSRLYFGNIGNNAPSTYTLPSGVHRPETGTNFDFYVNYYDPAGAPQSANVVVDGVCSPVTLEVGTADNGTYHTNLSVSSGCHQYWFLVYDNAGNRKAYPEVGAWGVGNCTGYTANATTADCEVCTPGATQACGLGQCAGMQTCAANATWGPCDGPAASMEVCDGIDNDCDGNLPADEADADLDTYMVCENDCNDGDANINPGAIEACNGIDDDCTGSPGANEVDVDNDTYMVCENDCDDGDDAIHPGATEACNGADDNCDAAIDEGCPCMAGESRACGSDVGACVAGLQSCNAGAWGSCEGAIVATMEICNGEDDDCDGELSPNESDGDGDSYLTCDNDCDDDDASVHPGADEVCNDVDDNCDGAIDEECGCEDGASRACGTAEGACEEGTEVCVGNAWGPCEGGIEPTSEICDDAVDNDCNGVVDDCSDGAGGGTNADDRGRGGLKGSCSACQVGAPGGSPHHGWLLGLLFFARRVRRTRSARTRR